MDNLKEIIESILFIAGDAIEIEDIAEKLELEYATVLEAVNTLKAEYEAGNRGIHVIFFNDKVQLSSNPKYADVVAEVLNPIREKQLTKVVLETCAIIAYKQPITRLEVENVRGINSDYAISALLDNDLIEVVGRKDTVGKPLMFGTTDKFLKKFNLTAIQDLPDYDELVDRIKVLYEDKDSSNNLFNMDKLEGSMENQEESAENENIDDLELEELDDQEILKVLKESNEVYNDYDILGKKELEDVLFDEDSLDYLNISQD